MANLGIFRTVMGDDRISQAVDRIEKALARIETQAALSGGSGGADRGSNAALAARHESLRESVSASLAELDTLIERMEK